MAAYANGNSISESDSGGHNRMKTIELFEIERKIQNF